MLVDGLRRWVEPFGDSRMATSTVLYPSRLVSKMALICLTTLVSFRAVTLAIASSSDRPARSPISRKGSSVSGEGGL